MRLDVAMIRVCILIPAYNEEAAIGATLREYGDAFPDAEILVIDNNSSDATREIAAAELARGRADGRMGRVVSELRQGKGYAVRHGLGLADADIYIMVDADLTYRASDARILLDRVIADRIDMAVGDRVSSGAYRLQNERAGHSIGNAVLTTVISQLAGRRYRDVLSGLRVMSRPFVNQLDVRSEGFQLETELNVLAAHLRASVVEIPIYYSARPVGSASKLRTFRDGARILAFAITNWVAFFPLQAFALVAAAAMLIALPLGLHVISAFIASNYTTMPYPSSAVAAAALGVVAVQSIFAGLTLRILGRSQRRRDVGEFLEHKRQWNRRLDDLAAETRNPNFRSRAADPR